MPCGFQTGQPSRSGCHQCHRRQNKNDAHHVAGSEPLVEHHNTHEQSRQRLQAPRMAAGVGPMKRMDLAIVTMEMTEGNKANPKAFTH